MEKNNSLKELLVGLYLFFYCHQNPNDPYDLELSRLYNNHHLDFEKRIEAWTLNYASPTQEDLKLIEIMNNYNEKSNYNNKIIEINDKTEINNLKNRVKELDNQIVFLKNENIRLKNDEKKYEDEIKELKNNNNQLKKKFQLLKNDNNEIYDNNINYAKIIELMEEIKQKDNELKELKSKLPFNLNKNDKLMTVIFISNDQSVHYSFICKNNDKFNRIENLLYDEYPQFQETENYFTVNGHKIIKSKTMEENKIKNSDIIILNKYEI